MLRALRTSRVLIFLVFLAGCIEPYNFVVEDRAPVLVIEGWISDASFNKTVTYPSDGTRFFVKVSLTSDVTNSRSSAVSGATVAVADDAGNVTPYTEVAEGRYEILDDDFHAEEGRAYKLVIITKEGEKFESSWQNLPSPSPAMGTIDFRETEKLLTKYISLEPTLTSVKGFEPFIQLPPHDGNAQFYKWDFTPMWIFVAPLRVPPGASKKCWISNEYYLKDYVLQEDLHGGYPQGLFFVESFNNDKIWKELTVLITQQTLSKDYFFFLQEMQEQVQTSLSSQRPPFNLKGNIVSVTSDSKAIGFFGIAREEAVRWYFDSSMLSYHVEDFGFETCTGRSQNNDGGSLPGCPNDFLPPGCCDCMEYAAGGVPTNVEPSWWH